jgi:type IV secretion system protein VirB10
MNWKDRLRRRNDTANPASEEPAAEAFSVDPETGEVLSPHENSSDSNGDAAGSARRDAAASTVTGERSIPSVNRQRSIQSRVSSSLALGTFLLLGAGFLVWYYTTQSSRTREAETAARKADAVRAAGEMKVPPLGRIDPPKSGLVAPPMTVTTATGAIGTSSPPPAAVPPSAGGQPQKTPEQLALERQLGVPVLRRADTAQGTGAASHAIASSYANTPSVPGMPANLAPNTGPGLAQWVGALQMPGATQPATGSSLAAMLKPTPTPAVSAQMLPTRRMLLPKGAFIDCTLETALDSTYEGMTTCIGASDVYGADGKVVLLERGTKYVGEQRGEPRQGQARVFVVWNEARTPTGVVVQLASPGTDELGRNGLPGFVDTHFWQRFGAALLLSVVDGTMQAIAAHQQSGTNVGSGGGVVFSPLGGRDVIAEVLRSTLSIPPTVIKNQGDRIQILVARDVDFRSVYALRNDPANP